MSSRPKTSGRVPLTAFGGNRPITAATKSMLSVPERYPPGTARYGSARPGTRSTLTTAQGRGIGAQITVIDRPMTQQGLGGLKTSVQRSQRFVQDKSYFLGLLRTKISELNIEIGRLAKEVDQQSTEQSTYLTYDKRAKALAQEINDLQGEFADYNMLLDKFNTDAEMDDVQRECAELKIQNEHESRAAEFIFAERREKEAQIKELEKEIEEEKDAAGRMITNMNSELKEKYLQLKKINTSFQEQMSKVQYEIDGINSKSASLEDEVSMSQVKQEAVNLYQKIRELEEKKESLIEEEKSQGTPQQEQERLLKRVKEDNQEIATMDRQTNEIQEKTAKLREDLNQVEQDLEENQNERSQKYRELRKKDETMTNFLDSFDNTKTTELKRKSEFEQSVINLLQQMSGGLSHFQHVPSQQEFSSLREDLTFKESEMEKSKSTAMSLVHEQQKVNMDLQKIEQLEEKIKNEMEVLQKKMRTMEEEMHIYNNIDKLKSSAEEKRLTLTEERTQLTKQRDYIKQVLQEVQTQFDAIKKQLNDNETHSQLLNLERKWQHVEQTNFAMKEFIASRLAETDYKPLTKSVIKQVSDYNSMLHKKLLSEPALKR